LELWHNRNAVGTAQTLIHKGTNGYVLDWATNNLFRLRKSGGAAIVTATTAVTDTTDWHYIVAVRNGSESKLYLDGADVSGAVAAETLADTASPLRLGENNGATNFLNGVLDEVAISTGTITAAEVRATWLHGITDRSIAATGHELRAGRRRIAVRQPTVV
jgi:hypothetical protein